MASKSRFFPIFWTVALVAFGGLIAFLVVRNNAVFYHDDAYISLRYVRNWLMGYGLVFNVGQFVQGYTNLLHVWLVGALGWMGLDLVAASRVIGMASFCGLLWVMYSFRGITGNKGVISWIGFVLVLSSSSMLVWSFGGLEGVLFAALVTAGIFTLWVYRLKEGISWVVVGGLFLGLACITRPDGGAFVAVSGLWLLGEVIAGRIPLRRLLWWSGGVLMILLPVVLWQWLYYGDIVPNTFYAKMGVPLSLRLLMGQKWLWGFIQTPPFLPAFIVLAALLSCRHFWKNPTVWFLLANILAYLLFVVTAGGDHMPAFRLALPIIPLMAMLVSVLIQDLYTSTARILGILTILGLIPTIALQLFHPTLNPQGLDTAAQLGTAVGRHIDQHWPKGSLIALNTAGSTPYYAPTNTYIDMLGLIDPYIAQRPVEQFDTLHQHLAGHFKGDGAWVISQNPDYIILGEAQGNTEYDDLWFLSDLEIAYHPEFQQNYQLQIQTIPLEEQSKQGVWFFYYERIGP